MKLTYSPKALLLIGLACFALLGSACGSDESDVTASRDGGSDDDDNNNKADASLMCSGSETKTCTCSNGKTGRKTCKSSKFGSCVCAGSGSGDAGTTMSAGDLCKAGYYAGNFTGMYFPGVFGAGIGMSGFQVTIDGKPAGDIPALAFTLEENASGPAGEFYSFTVGNGCMTGNANAFGVIDNPFVAKITGTLDCNTGFFDGRLDGQYTLLGLSPIPSLFSGPLTSQFVKPQSLTDGEWMVMEPPALNGDPMGGGNGTWSADWAQEKAPETDTDPCAILNGDGGVPATADAGTPTTTTPKADAGVKADAGARDAGK